MAMFENFPYTDMHNLNLDWIIKIAKDFLDQYTHIQELIANGEESITNLTNESLAELDEKETALENALQAWYDTHSADIATQLARSLSDLNIWYNTHLSDLNTWYTTHQGYLDQYLQTSIAAFNSAAEQKAAQTIETIPDDYTTLANKVTDIATMTDYYGHPSVKEIYIFDNSYDVAKLNSTDSSRFNFANAAGNAVTARALKNTNLDIIEIFEEVSGNQNTIGYMLVDWSVYTNAVIQKTLPETVFNRKYSPTLMQYINTINFADNTPFIKELYINDAGNAAGLARVHNVYSNSNHTIRFSNYAGNAFVGNANFSNANPNTIAPIIAESDGSVLGYILVDWSIVHGDFSVNRFIREPAYHIDFSPSIKGEYAGLIKLNKIHTVGVGQEYQTIQAAVEASNDNDVIVIYPGVYYEEVTFPRKRLTLIGTNRDEVILQYDNNDYDNPPLEMCQGVLMNMTVKGYDNGGTVDPTYGKAYAMHCDFQTWNIIGGSLYVENVKFISTNFIAVGMGLRGEAHYEFVNCLFISEANREALFFHDANMIESSGSPVDIQNQSVSFRNCTFENNSSSYPTISGVSQERQAGVALIEWQRNIVYNKSSGGLLQMTKYQGRDLGVSNWLNTSDFVLKETSALNTVNAMNH